jgi:hypothetical protein
MSYMKKNIKYPVYIVILLFILHPESILSQEINHWETVVMAGDTWHYLVPSSEPPVTWTDTTFDDSGWLQGPGGFGYGDGDDATVLPQPLISVFIRINFDIIDTSSISMAILHVDFDDGFVAYLNGHEIARQNLGTPGVRPAYDEFAILTSYEAQLPTGGVPARFIIIKETISDYMVNGNNVLALQVHNCNLTSSDLSSTTFFSLGIKDSTYNYRPVPSWFTDPLNVTTNLPIIAIDTKGQAIPDGFKIMATIKVIDNGPGMINNLYQAATGYEGPVGIELHGQSSLMFPKKSFGVEIWNEAGLDSAASLLGMPEGEDWVLYAPYSDKSMLRNALTYYFGAKMGRWQPRFRFCTVFLNEDYYGVYLLIEKIKQGKERVDISNLRPDEVTGDNITGGYIVKVDKIGDLTPENYFTTYPSYSYPNTWNYIYTYVYPRTSRIVPQQEAYIKSFLTELENTLNGPSFSHPVTGFRKYMDDSSFVDYQIIQELSNNVDGYRLSTYFYKDRDSKGGKLYAGPLWDFNLGYGNEDYYDFCLSTSGWLYTHIGPNPFELPMHWWKRLMEDSDYSIMFINRWKELRQGVFRTDSIMQFIDNSVLYLGESVDHNYERWPILGTYVWPNYFIGSTYSEEIDYLKGWVSDRLQWIDNNIDRQKVEPVPVGSKNILVYPNPVKDEMTFVFSTASISRISVEIYDLTGRMVFNTLYFPEEAGYQQVNYTITGLSPGSYILKLKQGTRIIGNTQIIIL